MGFIKFMFRSYIEDGKKTKTLPGLIFRAILGYVLAAIVIAIAAVISFFCGLIPVIGWIVSIVCWVVIVFLIIGILYSIPGNIIMFLSHYNVIK